MKFTGHCDIESGSVNNRCLTGQNQVRICRLSLIIIIMVFLAVNRRPGCPLKQAIFLFKRP